MGKSGEFLKGLYEAFGRGDVPAVLAGLDPAIDWREAEGFRYADENPYVGPRAVAEGLFQRIASDVQNFAVTPVNIIDAGETVVVEGRYTGTVARTGVPVDAQFVHVWQLRDGKVEKFRQYTDTAQWSRAFGD